MIHGMMLLLAGLHMQLTCAAKPVQPYEPTHAALPPCRAALVANPCSPNDEHHAAEPGADAAVLIHPCSLTFVVLG